MKTYLSGTLLIFISLLLLSGCATQGVDLVKSGVTQVESVDSRKGHVIATGVEQFGEKVLVYGRVANVSKARILKGEVNVDLYDAKGVRIDKAKARYAFHRQAGKSSRTANFSTSLHMVPPSGSTIRINHQDTRSDEGAKGSGELQIM